MTILELSTKAFGWVRISTWKDDEEIVLLKVESVEDLSKFVINEDWEDAEVESIFCPNDGYLHIEIKMGKKESEKLTR